MLRCALAFLLALALVFATMPVRTALAPVARAAELNAAIPNVYVHMPRERPQGKQLQVLIALHGLGGNGEQFASNVLAEAERNHWLLVAPTINYGDWTDPTNIADEDPRLISWLSDFIDNLPDYVQAPVKPRVLLLGHSRGAQLAHRFALFEPQKVLAVAALAAGTYTLPLERSAQGSMIRFPFGIGDMKSIAGHSFSKRTLIEDTEFWVGVGTDDNNPGDLPRAWDQYLGTTRVQRARSFQEAMHNLGARSVLVNFRGEKHVLSPDMTATACSFLRALDLAHSGPIEPLGTPAAVRSKGARLKF
jgi:pimeloyl-ACP methyl ester carboxylesterase